MLFKPELYKAILDREKTQTRRLVKEGEVAVNVAGRTMPDPVFGDNIDAVYSASGSLKWQVRRTYAIQPGRGKKAVGRFRLLAIRRERLQDIKTSDVVAEGISPDESYLGSANRYRHPFVALWVSINTKKGTRWIDNPEVWVLEFELARTSD